MSKEAILNQVRESLQARGAKNPHSFPEPLYTSPMKITQENLLAEYIQNQIANKSEVYESSKENLIVTLGEILDKLKAKRVLCNEDLPCCCEDLKGKFKVELYTQSVDKCKEEIFGIDTSIVLARCGIANLGIIGLSSNINAPRLSSLVTNNCIFLLERKNIVENFYLGVEFIKNYEKERAKSEVLPTNIIFVAGPSRTADIELQTVFGVHGPRHTFVVLY